MRVRKVLGLLVAVPALVVATAAPGSAATPGAVAFAGTLKVTPTLTPGTGSVDVCFAGLSPAASACPNAAPSTGIAAGAETVDALDALQAHAEYTEVCGLTGGLPPTGQATITAYLRSAVSSDWKGPISATWQRVGLVAVIQGQAIGAAVFAPVTPMTACGQPVQVAVVGAAEFTR